MRRAERCVLTALHRHAVEHPDQRALVFLDADGAEAVVATFADVAADTRCAAWAWRCQGVQPGDTVLLVLDHSYDLVAGFLGALYAGAIPVILPNPRPHALHSYSEQLATLVQHTEATAVFATPAVTELMCSRMSENTCRFHAFRLAGAIAPPLDFADHPRREEETLYLQLTSGTTGAPKLAVLSQLAVMTNIRRVFDARYQTAGPVVGCMPFNHDGGLVLCLLIPLVMGQLSVHLRPTDWIARPELLWRAVTVYQGTVTFLPNFALNFMVRRVPSVATASFQLDSLHTIVIGAELTTKTSLQTFHAQFGQLGLKEEALCSAYGMAEQVAGVSFSKVARPISIDWVAHERLRGEGVATPISATDGDARAIVGCGLPLTGMQIQVVDDQRHLLPERTAGEIRLRSNHCFSGYHRRPDLTARVLHDGWYYTGDLGYLAGGELFILGRKDDLIIVGGENIQPQALEEIATDVLGAQGRLAVAFAIRDEELGTQLPVLVCETRQPEPQEQMAAWQAEITRQVQTRLNVALADIRFVPKGWVEQSDAKIARVANREKYLAEAHHTTSPEVRLAPALLTEPAALAQALLALVEPMLGIPSLQPEDNFYELGADSLTALRIALAVEKQFGVNLPAKFFEEPTVAHLARLIAQTTRTGTQHFTADDPIARWLVNIPNHKAPEQSWRRWTSTEAIVRKLALTYDTGIRLQRAWLALPGVGQLRFGRQIADVRRWGELVNEKNMHVAIQQSLLANTWMDWRSRALAVPLGTSPWVKVSGNRELWQPRTEGTGVIFLVLHSSLSTVFIRGLAAGGMKPMFIRGTTAKVGPHGHALQVYHGYQGLRLGQAVVIAGDGQSGQQGVPVPFYNGQRRFIYGGAELAVQTGARLVPVFCTIAPSGQVEIEVCAALASGAGTAQTQVERLTRAYADLVIARWPLVYSSLYWYMLEEQTHAPR